MFKINDSFNVFFRLKKILNPNMLESAVTNVLTNHWAQPWFAQISADSSLWMICSWFRLTFCLTSCLISRSVSVSAFAPLLVCLPVNWQQVCVCMMWERGPSDTQHSCSYHSFIPLECLTFHFVLASRWWCYGQSHCFMSVWERENERERAHVKVGVQPTRQT